jgi:RNA polymerase sigma-70 factor, ECF subfamily
VLEAGRAEVRVKEAGLNESTAAEREETTELFKRHGNGIYRYCLRRLGSPEEAEDALQVTYLNAWRSLKNGCRPQAGRAWLFQIAANVCASNLRSRLGGTRVEPRAPDTLDTLVAVEDVESDELLGLSEALRELPARQRRALVLRDWQGLSYNEIAAELAVSDAAVETLLFRARNKLAATLSNGEWRPKLATSARALLVWPLTFVRTKFALTGQLKLGLGVAAGAVAPLVAFGLMQTLLSGAHENTKPNRSPAIADSAPLGAASTWVEDRRRLPAATARAAEHETVVRDKQRRHAHRAHGSKPHSAGSHSSSAAPAPATSHEAKVVLCHPTQSDRRPGVTVNVSTHALYGHRRDDAGACG